MTVYLTDRRVYISARSGSARDTYNPTFRVVDTPRDECLMAVYAIEAFGMGLEVRARRKRIGFVCVQLLEGVCYMGN